MRYLEKPTDMMWSPLGNDANERALEFRLAGETVDEDILRNPPGPVLITPGEPNSENDAPFTTTLRGQTERAIPNASRKKKTELSTNDSTG
ncbi:hypothetical protein T265_04551 [Opisthorchis viverrini]|uniref:Uncharacterized protein n=1 Tax=Opisthorchis viverrini TaxID=6198 RepID=A0A074ZNL7_OPIVI|nr:hypothetical protein T265_04551 [Opisthorchis viverrini]KER28681.1 hypothetical protein T265_04551 [Opisthorchis viverrini]